MPECRKLEPTAPCCALLALITVAVYLPVVEASFVTFDDTYYVTSNPTVQAGLTWEGVRWAFTRAHAANWHPLTWLSHMLDCQLYGLKPAGHHLTSLLFHTANTLLLFGLLKRWTGAFWRSAFVAALFALHPLHVESVAWVAERKDVLSTFFFLLTLGAYVEYAKAKGQRLKAKEAVSSQSSVVSSGKPTDYELRTTDHGPRTRHHVSRFTFHVSLFYLLSLVFFALGLMSKPMLVTVPFVLLLLDYWPLGRMKKGEGRRQNAESRATLHTPSSPFILHPSSFILLEKVPFLALSVASCVVTLIAQGQGGALARLEGGSAVTLESRLINTPISYAWYLVKLVWPSDLAAIYPYVREWPLAQVLGATALLAALTGAALWLGRRWLTPVPAGMGSLASPSGATMFGRWWKGPKPGCPYLAFGWFWYLGTLVPVIGLVKVGAQSIADRYMYIPSIGLFIALAWGVADLTQGWAQRAVPLVLGAAVVLVACAACTSRQVLYWLDTETLFRHTLAVTQGNYVACNNLGFYFAQQGQHEMAKKYYRRAIESAPDYLGAWNNLGATLVAQKKFDEALSALQEAVSIAPKSAEAESNLGGALYCMGKTDEATGHLRKAIELNPEYALAHYTLGNLLLDKNRLAAAADEFERAARLNPLYAEAYYSLGVALAKQGKLEEAAAQFKRALALQPRLVPGHDSLGQVLTDQGKLDEAVAQFREVLRLQPNHQASWMQIGLARAKQGRPAEAAAAFSAAVRLKPEDVEAQCQLAAALAAQHKTGEAVQRYREALKLAPDLPEALNNLAWLLAANPDSTVRNGREAVALAERACKLTDYKQPLMVGTLAAAYAEAGRFPEALAAAEKAQGLAEQSNQPAVAARNHALLEQYRSGQPARETP